MPRILTTAAPEGRRDAAAPGHLSSARPRFDLRRQGRRALAAVGCLAGAAMLSSCGGGDGGGPPDPASCSLADQKTWLADYMGDWYFWAGRNPRPDPTAYGAVGPLFEALLYTGGDAAFPADRWSYLQPTAAFDQFFGAGRSLGYGLFVAGLEVEGRPDLPLRVRYVEPGSAAGSQLQRGDTLVSVNGLAASELIATNDYTALTPQAEGDRLQLVVRRGGVERNVELVASAYALTPVSAQHVLTSRDGRRVGYLVLKDFVSQARAPLEAAFAAFRAAGVQDLVVDLRYNGGGLVSVSRDLASYVVASSAVGETFTSLRYNERHRAADSRSTFVDQPSALGLSRVYVLAGERTCSAAELVINGLRPFVEVVQIGGSSCGKPVGFVPESQCGTTYSAVNFESLNADGQGRYFDGLAPACPVLDDLDHALGDPAEALTAAALSHADTGACPLAAGREAAAQVRHRVLRSGPLPEPAEPRGMFEY